MLKYGVKIWSTNKDWFGEVVSLFEKGIIDFTEVYLVPDSFSLTDFAIFKQKNAPVTLHAPHTTHNFDVFNLNERALNIWREQVLKLADFLQSRFIVIHPGVGDSMEVFQKESVKLRDPRVLMESMIKIGFVGVKEGGVLCFGYTEKQLEFIHKECGFEICLDVCHTVASAAWQEIDPYDFISDLLKVLNPFYFHLSGGFVKDKPDKHLDIWEGDFDFKWLKKQLTVSSSKKDIYLVFETPKKGSALDNDIKNIEYFKGL